jgi:Transposase Tn5 dimerisation domain
LIEIYFKILKSGCRVEQTLLATGERLKRYLALMSVVAWRLFWLTYVNRQDSEASCRSILTEDEWQDLYCTLKKTTTLPDQPPTAEEAIRWIAQLGGFLGRKHDGEPGVTVLWRGWQRLNDIVTTWRLLNSPLTYG